MSSPNSTPTSTPPVSSSESTMQAERSAQKASFPTLKSSSATRSASSTPVPESSQQRTQVRKPKGPSLRRPQSVVTIIVGPEEIKESFIVHKDIICHHSSFFAKAFNGQLLESKTQSICLPEVDIESFGLLVEWLYTQKLDIDPKDRDGNIILLAKLWTLAHRFSMAGLQNSIMDGLRPMVECAEGEGLKGFLYYAYESSNGESMLKSLAADRMAWATSAKGLKVWISGGHLPEGLLMDIVMSLKKDHVHGLEPTMRFGTFGSAKEYYVGIEEKMVVPKKEK